jgi:hypothetical protein
LFLCLHPRHCRLNQPGMVTPRDGLARFDSYHASTDMMATPGLCLTVIRGGRSSYTSVCGKHTMVRLQMSLQISKQLGQSGSKNTAKFVVGNQTKCPVRYCPQRLAPGSQKRGGGYQSCPKCIACSSQDIVQIEISSRPRIAARKAQIRLICGFSRLFTKLDTAKPPRPANKLQGLLPARISHYICRSKRSMRATKRSPATPFLFRIAPLDSAAPFVASNCTNLSRVHLLDGMEPLNRAKGQLDWLHCDARR